MGEKLKACPFCGADAHRIDIPAEDGEADAGASYIECTRCCATTGLHFDRKKNLVSSWNDRKAESFYEDVAFGLATTLSAAISLLENVPNARGAAPSDKMFVQMLKDYKAVLKKASLTLNYGAMK